MTQGHLNLQPAAELLAGARRTDPQPSWEAYEAAMKSGVVRERLHCIMETPGMTKRSGMTYRELYRVLSFVRRDNGVRLFPDAVETMRRLNTLERLGFVEKIGTKRCAVTGNKLTAWRLA